MARGAEAFRPFYDLVRAQWPIFPDPIVLSVSDPNGAESKGVDSNGRPVFWIDPNYEITDVIAYHECGHAFEALLAYRGISNDRLRTALWQFRGWPGTWQQQDAYARTLTGWQQWQNLPVEIVAETWRCGHVGAPTTERTVYLSEIDQAAQRAFYKSMEKEAGVVSMSKTVLWHLSHHSSTHADGWSGAPDEARWVREDLTPRVVAACAARGIQVVTVDGDGGSSDNLFGWHPAFDLDYDAFCAPHYEANLHNASGAFWGRAALSVTAAEDDRLGGIFWKYFRQIPGAPPDRFDWKGSNVTAYYGFNLTTSKTPGILVEHGVGWLLDSSGNYADYDYTWLRANVQAIANAWALALAEFTGLSLEDDMFTDADRAKLNRVYDILEAEEPRIWTQRLQDWLSKALKSMPGYAKPTDYTGPDVTSGLPRT